MRWPRAIKHNTTYIQKRTCAVWLTSTVRNFRYCQIWERNSILFARNRNDGTDNRQEKAKQNYIRTQHIYAYTPYTQPPNKEVAVRFYGVHFRNSAYCLSVLYLYSRLQSLGNDKACTREWCVKSHPPAYTHAHTNKHTHTETRARWLLWNVRNRNILAFLISFQPDWIEPCIVCRNCKIRFAAAVETRYFRSFRADFFCGCSKDVSFYARVS